jgi:lipoprotein-anchoring transpeptidase ErfK/SrfK
MTIAARQLALGLVPVLLAVLASSPARATAANDATACPAPATTASTTAAPLIGNPPSALGPSASAATVSAPVDTQGQSAMYYVRYGTTAAYGTCTAPGKLAALSGQQAVDVQLTGLAGGTAYHFELVVTSSAGTATSADQTFKTAPGPKPVITTPVAKAPKPVVPTRIAGGVKLGPILVGGLTKTAALKRLTGFLSNPVHFSFNGARWSATGSKLGAKIDTSAAITAALAAPQGKRVPLNVTVDIGLLHAYLGRLNTRFAHSQQKGAVRLNGVRAVVTPSLGGLQVNIPRMTGLVRTELLTGNRRLLTLATDTTPPPAAATTKAVVVRLDSQTLTAYLNGKAVLTTPVTTGRPALPTPTGSFYIHYRASPYVFTSPWPKGSAYYYPPTPVTWAMYFEDNDFLHDDPGEPAGDFGAGSENGPWASHGCVHVPHDAMAFLYNWLPVGAPVIVSDT